MKSSSLTSGLIGGGVLLAATLAACPDVLADDAYILRSAGGNLNGQVIDAESYEVWVEPGENIVGVINVETNNIMPPSSVAPLGWTVDWGTREEQPHLTNSWIAPGIQSYAVNVDTIAPDTPGVYRILIAFGGEFTIAHVMAATNWPCGEPVWHDGNDLGFDWNEQQFNDAIDQGRVYYPQLQCPAGYVQNWRPATAVTVHVLPDIVAYAWEKVDAPLGDAPLPVTAPMLAVHDGLLYAMGGRLSHFPGTNDDSYSAAIYSGDAATGQLELLPDELPYGMGLHHPNRVIVGDTYYIPPMLGTGENNGWGQHTRMVEYDFTTGQAVETAEIPGYSRIWGIALGRTHDGRVYVFGGYNGGCVNKIWRYDSPGAVVELPETMFGGCRPSGITTDALGNIVTFGVHNSRRVEVFDPESETIVYSQDDLPDDIGNGNPVFTWTTSDGRTFLAGYASRIVHEFDPETRTITRAGFQLPAPATGWQLNSHTFDPESGRLYLAEGHNTAADLCESTLWVGTPATIGDINCDGAVDFDDIDAFVAALQGDESYAESFPTCNRNLADCNGDQAVDFDDIDAFVALLGR